MDKETPKCKIDAIPRKEIQMFEWLSIPLDMGYKACSYCMADFKDDKSIRG
jgi:hypothetical protein